MHEKDARCSRGCWPTALLLSCVLALLLVPLPVLGDTVAANITEAAGLVNRSSLLNEGAGPEQVDEVLTGAVTGAGLVAAEAAAGRAGRVIRAGEKDEQGSGMFGETAVLPAVEEVGVAAPPQLSPDSAETELLLPSNPRREEAAPPTSEKEEEEEEVGGEEEREAESTNPPWLVAKDTSVFDLDPRLLTTTPPPPGAVNPSHPDILHVDFFDQAARGRSDLAPPSPSSLAHELQGGDPTSWAMPDSYDYLTPYDEGVSPTADEYTYSTTTETYDSAEDPRLAPGRPGPRAPEDKAPLPGGGAAAESPDTPRVPVYAVDGSDGLGGCRVGYQMLNGSCRSPCDSLTNYCFNGGQCYLIEGQGALCRCNVQDYIWHKGSRCDAVVTEFQVMCLGVGASALVLLLLFMIVVCFAKKLHVLKTENNKLRKRSKYRPSSEQHNDNFSLSTIAEGSHPNVRKLCDTPPNVPHARALAYYDNIICQDDPGSQNKLEDPVKASPREDDSLNIHNSLTPKHENHKVLGEENSSEVNSLQNNMM
ncbi:chondroitin sulfate proteoglycan 5 isoform X2 [Gadus morhua]|uniref:chondroitin sulfate proteoglycan 5 isoform X2 n=1 Tax=Gadus morhua TaxID=8049 RepID=UPI0011B6F25E|nr:chondroitin sulfate proteoglycan 5 isoform X2 [Gadus morhua]